MPRSHHRPRRPISVARARLLPLFGFRYSTTRDAYVLRFIGNHVGPVYQVMTGAQITRSEHAAAEQTADEELHSF